MITIDGDLSLDRFGAATPVSLSSGPADSLTFKGISQYDGASFSRNFIPLKSLVSTAAPTVANFKQFVTPYVSGSGGNQYRGFAIQGVNSSTAGTSGTVVAASLFNYDNVAYKVSGLTANSAAGASTGAVVFTGMAAFGTAGTARRPTANPGNARVVDAGDERMASSVCEANGRIYSVQTVDLTADGRGEAAVCCAVYNATTFAFRPRATSARRATTRT